MESRESSDAPNDQRRERLNTSPPPRVEVGWGDDIWGTVTLAPDGAVRFRGPHADWLDKWWPSYRALPPRAHLSDAEVVRLMPYHLHSYMWARAV